MSNAVQCSAGNGNQQELLFLFYKASFCLCIWTIILQERDSRLGRVVQLSSTPMPYKQTQSHVHQYSSLMHAVTGNFFHGCQSLLSMLLYSCVLNLSIENVSWIQEAVFNTRLERCVKAIEHFVINMPRTEFLQVSWFYCQHYHSQLKMVEISWQWQSFYKDLE